MICCRKSEYRIQRIDYHLLSGHGKEIGSFREHEDCPFCPITAPFSIPALSYENPNDDMQNQQGFQRTRHHPEISFLTSKETPLSVTPEWNTCSVGYPLMNRKHITRYGRSTMSMKRGHLKLADGWKYKRSVIRYANFAFHF